VEEKVMAERIPESVGAANPYAIAELKMGKSINWKRVASPRALLEKTLGMPYEKLFDPKHNSPVYAGLAFDRDQRTMVKALAVGKTATLPVQVEAICWVDPGDFFEDGAEMTDPVQGGVGDCYFIAALSSVAWSRTYVVAQRSAVGPTGPKDMIEFFKQGAPSSKVQITEELPLQSPGNNFIYARSADPGEIWPAVYEKAYTKWRTNDPGDRPAYASIAGGDPVGACYALMGGVPSYFSTAQLAPGDIWKKVRENSISYKAFNPMVAWTYPSGDVSPDKVNYDTAHLAANHAYSIFGWAFANNKMYLVVRNPWGTYESTLNPEITSWVAWDAPYMGGPGWWRTISMATPDGIFAIEVEAFKKYFAGFGFVK
jgi:hypothetical protein